MVQISKVCVLSITKNTFLQCFFIKTILSLLWLWCPRRCYKSFLQEYDNLTFIEALTKLAQEAANLELQRKQRKMILTTTSLYRIKLTADFYSRSLENNLEAKTYLQNRDIDQSMIDVFQLGLSNNKWDDLTNLFSNEKIIKNAIEAGLVIKSNNKLYDRFRNEKIMFPIRNSAGNIIGLEQGYIIRMMEQNI